SSGGSYQNPLYKQSTFHHAEFKVARSAATASIDESVPIFNGYGVQNSKLIFGLAFYGVKQTRTYNSSTGVYGSWVSAGSVFYDVLISNYLSNNNYLKIYDTVAKVPYIVNMQGTEFVSYDSPRSIQDKGEYILAKGLGGLMFWEYGTDTSGILLAAMGSALNKS